MIYKGSTFTLCEYECGKYAALDCAACSISFCDMCFATSHSKAAFKSHQKVGLGEAKKLATCLKHSEELKIYCQNCSTPICLMCSTFGDHNKHKCILLVDYVAACKKDIPERAKELQARANKITDLTKKIEKEIESVIEVLS